VKVCEIFDVQKDQDPPLPLRQGFSRQSFIGEEDESDDDADQNEGAPVDSGLSLTEDAAVAAPPSIHHRDACCSPVRELDDQPTTSTYTSSSQQRTCNSTVRSAQSNNSLKSTPSAPSANSVKSLPLERSASVRSANGLRAQRRQQPHAPHKRLSIPNPRGRTLAPSSDSEADGGEKFFVPDRRQRTSSDEYDGEPEPSDTEEGV
jgi:hypothetical protein